MIEAAMYFVLGVLTAGLLALTVTPAIWRRASRLTRARVEAMVPMSLAEIRADKDQLRAEYAIATRRLETTIGQLEERTTGQLIELNRKRNEAAQLAQESAARAETIRQLEERVAGLTADIGESGRRIEEARKEIAERDSTLAVRARRIADLETELAAAIQLTEEQKLELVVRDTQLGNHRDEIAAGKVAHASLSLAHDNLAAALAEEKASLAREQQRGEGLEARIAALEVERTDRLALLDRRAAEIKEHEAELAAERTRREALAAEIARLEGERDVRAAELAASAAEIERLKAEAAEAARRQAEAETLLAAAEARYVEVRSEATNVMMKAELDASSSSEALQKAIAVAEDEKAGLLARLSALEDAHEALRAENEELRRIAGSEWETERVENARLRERLSSVAAEVVRMTQNGNGAGVHVDDGNGAGRMPIQRPGPAETAPRPPSEGKTLAERIRALQHSAARH